jgi:hypothetical protein
MTLSFPDSSSLLSSLPPNPPPSPLFTQMNIRLLALLMQHAQACQKSDPPPLLIKTLILIPQSLMPISPFPPLPTPSPYSLLSCFLSSKLLSSISFPYSFIFPPTDRKPLGGSLVQILRSGT